MTATKDRPYDVAGFLKADPIGKAVADLFIDGDVGASHGDYEWFGFRHAVGDALGKVFDLLPPRNKLDEGAEGAPTLQVLATICPGSRNRLIYEGFVQYGVGERVSVTGVKVPADLVNQDLVDQLFFYEPDYKIEYIEHLRTTYGVFRWT